MPTTTAANRVSGPIRDANIEMAGLAAVTAAAELGKELARPDLTKLNKLIKEHGFTEQQQVKWCQYFKTPTLGDLTQQQVDGIVKKIEATIGQKAA